MRKRLTKILKRIKREFLIVHFYEDLNDLPFYNWRKLHETGDFSFLIKKGSLDGTTRKRLAVCWHKLNNEYLKKYGLDLKMRIMLQDRKRLALSLSSYVSTLDKSHEMEADILQIDIKKANKTESKPISYVELISQVEESRGIPINEKETSTDRFFTYLKIIKDRNSKKLNFKAS